MEEEIDFKVIFDVFWSKKIAIISVAIIFAILGFIYSKVLVTPKYTATAKMILVSTKSTDESGIGITSSDITLNNNLIGTYKEIAKSNSVVRQVLDNLSITDLSEETLKNMIDISSQASTQMINVSITDIDPDRATKITNELTKVFSSKIEELYKLENINVVDEAELPEYASNINTTRTVILFFIIGFSIALGVVFLINMMDTTVKNTKDIEKNIRIPVLAELPQCDFSENSIKRRRK